MDFEKTSESFQKHFARKCEKICFAGMPLTILKGKSLYLSAVLSVGGCTAMSRRDDGRFNARFDDNTKRITLNVAEIEYHKKEPMLEFLTRPQELGAILGGADIIFEYNTKIYNEYEPLLLSSMYLFCNNMPKIQIIKNCLSYPLRDFAGMVAKKDTVLLCGAEKYTYIKFSDNAVKIVLCTIKDDNYIEESNDKVLEEASKNLAIGDYLQFGEIITNEHKRSIKNGRVGKASKEAFELAVRLNDAFGYGFLERGGIFAVVKNSRVNAFVQNMKKEYGTYYGAPPDFYVTRTENSGINRIIDKKDL